MPTKSASFKQIDMRPTTWLLSVILMTACATASADDRLKGTWRLLASQVDGVAKICGDSGAVSLRFADGKVTFLYDDQLGGMPRHGAILDCAFDQKQSPNRVVMSFSEAGSEHTVAYCIYEVKGDTLMMRLLYPMALGQSRISDDKRRAFYKEPFPTGFTTTRNDATALMILRRVADASASAPEAERSANKKMD
jgi:hypothetical protein